MRSLQPNRLKSIKKIAIGVHLSGLTGFFLILISLWMWEKLPDDTLIRGAANVVGLSGMISIVAGTVLCVWLFMHLFLYRFGTRDEMENSQDEMWIQK